MRSPIAREGAARLTTTSDSAQLEFLTRIQRILGEGQFVADVVSAAVAEGGA